MMVGSSELQYCPNKNSRTYTGTFAPSLIFLVKLFLTILPSKYKYVLVETNAPNGYYQPVNGDEETEFDVESGTVIINSVKIKIHGIIREMES